MRPSQLSMSYLNVIRITYSYENPHTRGIVGTNVLADLRQYLATMRHNTKSEPYGFQVRA